MPSEIVPESVTKLLKSTRYIHLATCNNNIPHVSLMIFTYYRDAEGDFILFTTPKKTTKYENIVNNANVSLLVHDWTTSRAKEDHSSSGDDSSRRNSLYELLTNLNKTEISSVSVMMNGEATILDSNNEKIGFYRSLHSNNSSIDPSAKNYVEGDDNALVLVRINSVKVTDLDNNISEYQK